MLTGVTFQISDELGIDEDAPEFSKNVFMSNDDMLKFLSMEDFDSDDDDGPVADSRMPWDLSFDKLRSKMTDLLENGLVSYTPR